MSFLDVSCSQPFQKKGTVFPVHVNVIIQEVDAQHTTERHQRGFKVPMETGSESQNTVTITLPADFKNFSS